MAEPHRLRQSRHRGGVRQPRPRTTAPHKHVAGAAPSTSTTCPSPPGTAARLSRPQPSAPMHASRRSTSTPVRAAPGVVAVLTAADIPGDERCRPGRTARRAGVRRPARSSIVGQSLFAVAADDARAGARAPPGWPTIDVRGPAGGRSTSTAALPAGGELVTEPLTLRARRRRRGASPRAPHRLAGPDRDRRPGAFLSRRPGRAGRARRGRRHAWSIPRPSIRPRSSTWSRMCWACRPTP